MQVPQLLAVLFNDRNACLQCDQSEICTMRSLLALTTRKLNFGWSGSIGARHSIGIWPGLQSWFWNDTPTSPFG